MFVTHSDEILPASLIAYAACFLTTFYFLGPRVRFLERFMISVSAMISGIWLFETVYHYSWGFGGLATDLSQLSIAYGGNAPFPIYYALALILLPLIGSRYMSLNVFLLAILGASITLFGLWLFLGFPQFWCNCEFRTFLGSSLPAKWTVTAGYILNSAAKLLCVVPAFLFYNPELLKSNLKKGNKKQAKAIQAS